MEKDWVCDGFSVTVAGAIVCAGETAAITSRIIITEGVYVVRMIFSRLTIHRLGLVLLYAWISLIVLWFTRRYKTSSACLLLSHVGSWH